MIIKKKVKNLRQLSRLVRKRNAELKLKLLYPEQEQKQ